MMKNITIVEVWLLLVIGVVVETVIYYASPGGGISETVIGVIAAAAAITTATFSMGLKDEQGAIRLMLLVPVGLLAVLAFTMLLAYPVSF